MRILVAGGSTGIGAAAIRGFLERGDEVVLADIAAPSARLSASVAGRPGRLFQIASDFAAPCAVTRAVAHAVTVLGGLDAVFYNAGVLESHTLADWTPERWNRSVAVNLTAPFLIAQAAAPHLIASRAGGSILITASTGALRGHAGMPAYHATKSGVLGLVRALADELGPSGVTVNALCPGWVETPFNDAFWAHQDDPERARLEVERSIPLGYQAQPEDIVGTILFLTSLGSRYITGQAIVVDGGHTAV